MEKIKTWLENLLGVNNTEEEAPYIYGVTDRSRSNPFVQLNDSLINISPVSTKEKGLFFYSLQMLVTSGVEFTRALDMLSVRVRNPRLKRILQTVAYDMRIGGMSFSAALGKYPSVFKTATVKMLLSGEVTGKMEETLENISTQVQKNLELEGRIKSALMYPATVLGAIVIAGGVVMTMVVPQFLTLFEQFGSDLPRSTKILIGMSDFFQDFWWLVLAGIVGIFFMVQNWLATPKGAETWSKMVLQLPGINKLAHNIQTTRIASNLATLMESGVGLDDALPILSQVVGNKLVEKNLKWVNRQVLKGKKLSQAFAENPLFDPILAEISDIGEQTGRLPQVLRKTADQYQREVDAQLKNLSTLIEPFIIVFVGGAVVFMAMAILSPIFELQNMFGGI